MADYCNQCTGQHCQGDLSELSSAADTLKGLYPLVLCEGCGTIQVDHEGNCVSHIHHEDGSYEERQQPIETPHTADPSCP